MTGMRWTEEQYQAWLREQQPPPSQVIRGAAVEAKAAPRTPGPNKTEQRYIDEVLAPAQKAGEIVEWRFEAVNLRIGPRCHYRPDFLVVLSDGGLRFDEIKGGWAEEDAIVKFKAAVDLYPWLGWRLCRYAKKQWSVEVWR